MLVWPISAYSSIASKHDFIASFCSWNDSSYYRIDSLLDNSNASHDNGFYFVAPRMGSNVGSLHLDTARSTSFNADRIASFFILCMYCLKFSSVEIIKVVCCTAGNS